MDIALRKLPGQYRQGLAFVQKVCEEKNINVDEMEFIGHSLGGYLAITTSMALGVLKVYALNSAGPSEKIKDELEKQIPGISMTAR